MANTCLHIDSKDRFSTLIPSQAINANNTYYPQSGMIGLNPSNPGIGSSIVSTDLQGLVLRYSQNVGAGITEQPLVNSFTIQAPGPLIYGYMRNIKIASVNLQYDIPTIIPSVRGGRQTPYGNDKFFILNDTVGATSDFTIPYGYYTPNELCAMVQSLVRADAFIGMPQFVAFYTRTGYVFRSYEGPTPVPQNRRFAFLMTPDEFIPDDIADGTYTSVLKCLRMFGINIANRVPRQEHQSARGTCLYTDYIDICSTNLTKYQKSRDTDSDPKKTNNIICRFYLGGGQPTEIKGDSALGSAPFTLYQHYNTTKTIRWSAEEAIHEIDIQLRDMWGDLLYTGNIDNIVLPTPFRFSEYISNTEFQMTLLCFEDGRH